MDILIHNTGWIEAICGPMFSGKSEELIRRLRRASIARKRVQVFKPAIDSRYSASEIVTHNDNRMQSDSVCGAGDILKLLDWRVQVVGVDESNFFGMDLVDVASQLADSGKQVIIAGLDTDYRGRPFQPMPDLLAVAESITKMLAICVRCGNPAKHTQRLVESDELIFVGAAGSYEARCRRCFEPGVPRQEVLRCEKSLSLKAGNGDKIETAPKPGTSNSLISFPSKARRVLFGHFGRTNERDRHHAPRNLHNSASFYTQLENACSHRLASAARCVEHLPIHAA